MNDIEFLFEEIEMHDSEDILRDSIEKRRGQFGELSFIRSSIPGTLYTILSHRFDTDSYCRIMMKEIIPGVLWNEIGAAFFILYKKTDISKAEEFFWYLIEAKDRSEFIARCKSILTLIRMSK
jgi:hypothetical protein